MNLDQRIAAFTSLRSKMLEIDDQDKESLFRRAQVNNPWFTASNLDLAWKGVIRLLEPENLSQWISKYDLTSGEPATVGIVMAGNIPMVGFHDMLCVLIAGHRAAIKMSSQDEVLIGQLLTWLAEVEPHMSSMIERREMLKDINAVIATGSDNSARYFHYYFSKMPHIIRKNRTSVAVLGGEEDEEELTALGKDIYSYFGLGCRNVSKIYVPQGYDIRALFPLWESYVSLTDHHKYKNNYDYNKSIYLVNKEPHLDTGFSLWLESEQLVSPIAVTYWQSYESTNHLQSQLQTQEDKLQCVVASELEGAIPFGTTQMPDVWDYADNVDTLAFLAEL